ncbi:hypothetical protein PgNI_10773 [Pyricularia grisea]|uniref:S-adenosyl-L-methionine-dependent methyltransferase n=1 Tax=Pyricularia grisea TaxID=148305 RepID=A0A6P8AZ36_PYRGI|nr:hypothetical protein PgNI_10773 [Pyricularia grisea]TLD07511.1 hypothetical protein PgNI_10773 [Pyricularia grisea]
MATGNPQPPKENANLHDVEETLLTTLFAKARDAESDKPILGDPYARPLLDRCAVDLNRPVFRGIDNGPAIRGIATRSRAIDDLVREFLDQHAGNPVTVVHLGCGMDTRALRIARGPDVRWVDLDLPDVADLRRRVITNPAPAGDYQLYGGDASDLAWLEKVPAGCETLVAAEGMLLYWEPSSVERLLRAVVEHFGSGELVFDVTSEVYVRLSDHVEMLQGNGARWRWGVDDTKIVERLHPGLRLVAELDMTTPEVLERILRGTFGDRFEQVRPELELSLEGYKAISKVLKLEFRK